MAYANENLIVTSPVDCGNAPKRVQLKEFIIAFAKTDIDIIIANISDDFKWDIIGDKTIQDKENIIAYMQQLENDIAELHIQNIITHGKTAALNGKVILKNKQHYAFSNVYLFKSAAKNSKIIEKTSYIIEIF